MTGGRKSKPFSAEDLAAWRRLASTLDKKFRAEPESPAEAQQPAPPPPSAAPPPPFAAAPRALRRLEFAPKPEPRWRHAAAKPLVAAQPDDGIDRRTARRLKRGELRPAARIDLHGMTEANAHQALNEFIHREAAQGSRWVLVITGKGRRDAADGDWARIGRSSRGLLARLAPQWLSQPPLSGLVTNVVQAPRIRGGEGALYVSLRRLGR